MSYSNLAQRVAAHIAKEHPGFYPVTKITIGSVSFYVNGVTEFNRGQNYAQGAAEDLAKATWTASFTITEALDEALREKIEGALKAESVAVELDYLARDPKDAANVAETQSSVKFDGKYIVGYDLQQVAFNSEKEPMVVIGGKSIPVSAA